MNTILSERKRLGMRQVDLANKLGVSVLTVSRWERGINYPTGSQLIKMSRIFDCSTDYLLGTSSERKPIYLTR